MNRVISWLQSIRLRQIVTVFLVVLTLFFANAFGIYGNQLQAQAEAVTPEATNYKADSGDNQISTRAERIKEDAQKSEKLLAEEGIKVTNRAAESAKNPNKNLFDSIREKLNLDEPIDPGTKQAGEQIKDATSKAVKAPGRALKDATD